MPLSTLMVTFAPAQPPRMNSLTGDVPARTFLSSSGKSSGHIVSLDGSVGSLPMDLDLQAVNNSLRPAEPSWQGTWLKITDVDRLLHPHWLGFQSPPYAFHLCVAVAVMVTTVASLVGNILVVWSIARFRCLRTSSNMFVVSLALADIMMDSLSLPLFSAASFIGYWPFGYYGCQFYGVTTATVGLVTINTLAAISYDRYTVVVRHMCPRQHDFKAVNLVFILIIWVISFLWASGPLLGWGHYTLEGIGTTCTYDYLTRDSRNVSFVVALMVFNFGCPLLLITFCYSRIFQAVSSVRRDLMNCSPQIAVGTQRQVFDRQTELKTASTIFIIICFFCIAWTPYVVVSLIGLFGDVTLVTPLVAAIPCVFCKIATVSNPLLYSLGHPKFRKKIVGLLKRTSSASSYYVGAGTTSLHNTRHQQSSSV